MQKVSSEDSGGNTLLKNSSSLGLFPNFKRNKRTILDEYDDRVPCNCSILEVVTVYENSQPKETIFMGTYDSHLYAMRMVIKEEQGDNHSQYVL
jgi:hypothetical protein